MPATSRNGDCSERRSARGRAGSPSKSMKNKSPSASRTCPRWKSPWMRIRMPGSSSAATRAKRSASRGRSANSRCAFGWTCSGSAGCAASRSSTRSDRLVMSSASHLQVGFGEWLCAEPRAFNHTECAMQVGGAAAEQIQGHAVCAHRILDIRSGSERRPVVAAARRPRSRIADGRAPVPTPIRGSAPAAAASRPMLAIAPSG